jgi:dTDP-4-amino-4,6-dideoxygalactose transaminase
VIYDASHAFGTNVYGKSVLEYGDISTISFHATKLFHTVEGGAVVSKSSNLIRRMSFARNFGHKGYYDFEGLGINAKNSEFHAAMGLANLKYVDELIAIRKQLSEYYDQQLKNLRAQKVLIREGIQYNYAYFPVIFDTEGMLLKQLKELEDSWIYPRRYFYPSLNQLPYVEHYDVPVTDDVAKRTLCLPLYHDLTFEDIDLIVRLMLRTQNN